MKFIICFDLETTGLDPKENRIIECGVQIYKKERYGLVPYKAKDFFIKQEKPIPEEIVKLTHITDDMCKDGLDEKAFADGVRKVLELPESLIIGYNIQFDLSFIIETLKRHDPSFVFNATEHQCLDVMSVYKDFFMYSKNLDENGKALGHRLCGAIVKLHVKDVENSHRAVDDAKATAEVYKHLYSILKRNKIEMREYVNMFGYNPKYGVSYEKIEGLTYIPQRGFAGREIINFVRK